MNTHTIRKGKHDWRVKFTSRFYKLLSESHPTAIGIIIKNLTDFLKPGCKGNIVFDRDQQAALTEYVQKLKFEDYDVFVLSLTNWIDHGFRILDNDLETNLIFLNKAFNLIRPVKK